MNAIIDILAEALSAYWKALGKTWAKLLAVFLPANIFLVWIRAQTAMRFDAGDGIPAIALRPERHVSLLINLTLGALALVIIARAAWQTLAKPSDEADVSRSLVASIGRTFGTVMLLCFLVGAYLFVALVGIYFLLPKIVGLFGLSVPSAVGIMQRALDEAVAYAKIRKQFGKPIIKFQMVQGLLADMAIKTEAARCLVNNTMRMIDAGMDVRKEGAITKCFVTDVAQEVTSNAVQVLGGYGYSREYPVEKLMRDVKIFQIFEGTNQIQRQTIAKCLEREYPDLI